MTTVFLTSQIFSLLTVNQCLCLYTEGEVLISKRATIKKEKIKRLDWEVMKEKGHLCSFNKNIHDSMLIVSLSLNWRWMKVYDDIAGISVGSYLLKRLHPFLWQEAVCNKHWIVVMSRTRAPL